jgi:hypothetical protein
MDSAFERLFGTTQTRRENGKTPPNEWEYVGRFMWGFGRIESLINELLRQLFGLRGLLYLLLLANIDFRKKIDLMRIGFKHQGMNDHAPILNRVHKLADIRNAVGHGSFYYEPVYKSIIFDDFVSKAVAAASQTKGQSEIYR